MCMVRADRGGWNLCTRDFRQGGVSHPDEQNRGGVVTTIPTWSVQKIKRGQNCPKKGKMEFKLSLDHSVKV